MTEINTYRCSKCGHSKNLRHERNTAILYCTDCDISRVFERVKK